jgi:hypothetical protein
MKPKDEFDTLRGLLTVLALCEGGIITLPLREVRACNDRYCVSIEEDTRGQNVTIEVRSIRLRLFRPGNKSVRRQLIHPGGGNRPA